MKFDAKDALLTLVACEACVLGFLEPRVANLRGGRIGFLKSVFPHDFPNAEVVLRAEISQTDDLLRRAKIAEWKQMLESGKLKALGKIAEKGGIVQDISDDFDQKSSKRRARRKRLRNKNINYEHDGDGMEVGDYFSSPLLTLTQEKEFIQRDDKPPAKSSDWRGTFMAPKKFLKPDGNQIFNPNTVLEWRHLMTKLEVVYKNSSMIYEMISSKVNSGSSPEDVVLCHAIRSLAKLGQLKLALAVHYLRSTEKIYEPNENHWEDECGFKTTVGLCTACYRNGLHIDGNRLSDDLNKVKDPELRLLAKAELIPESISMNVEFLKTSKKMNKESSCDAHLQTIDCAISELIEQVINCKKNSKFKRDIALSACNAAIRHLGRADLLERTFVLLDAMKQANIQPDDETYEFISNAAVKEVVLECTAKSMKTLPSPAIAADVDEVLFAGRSNVGKSSLVNMLVNRKAIASTSSKPGHTTKFNFYAINPNRDRGLRCRFVDVPGLGFADAESERMDSWRSTLQRYLSVRESLRIVFHLVDVNTGPEKADRTLIEMVKVGMEHNRRMKYVIVLTKADKLRQGGIAKGERLVRQFLNESGMEGVLVIRSSSKSKMGRDEMWETLHNSLKRSPT